MEQASDAVVATRAALAQLMALAVQYSFSIIGALILITIGWIASGMLSRWAFNGMSRIHGIDATLAHFFSKVVRYGVLILVFVMALGQFGVQTASILAALGAIGLAVGLALQGTLQNIAAGIMLLVLRPFRVGETIETSTVNGTVIEVGLFATELRTAEGVYRLAPNSTLWNVPITNFSRLKTRRHEVTISIDSGECIDKAQQKLLATATAEKHVLNNPAPTTYVAEFDSGSAKVTLRYWMNASQWWETSRHVTKAVKLAFDKRPEPEKKPEAKPETAPESLIPDLQSPTG